MTKKRKPALDTYEPCYEVAVWNHEGDVVEVLWSATADELDEIREKYADDPLHDVVAEER